VHPEIGISSKAMSILDSFIQDQFDKIASEAAKLARVSRKVRPSPLCAANLNVERGPDGGAPHSPRRAG